jgi:hypothetical protein
MSFIGSLSEASLAFNLLQRGIISEHMIKNGKIGIWGLLGQASTLVQNYIAAVRPYILRLAGTHYQIHGEILVQNADPVYRAFLNPCSERFGIEFKKVMELNP